MAAHLFVSAPPIARQSKLRRSKLAHRFNHNAVNFSMVRRPERTAFTITDSAGHVTGRIEGSGVRWRAWTWAEVAGEWYAVPGSYPSEASARAALTRRTAP
jgi:hypothetical protein